MRPKPASSPLRRFLRGLTNTCLLFLLPVQLGLVWLAQLDRPARLPDFLAERVTAALATEGIGLRARALWILPDLTLAEMRSAHPGITEDVFAVLGVENSVNSRTSWGGTAPEQVRANAATAEWRLTPDEVAEVGKLVA